MNSQSKVCAPLLIDIILFIGVFSNNNDINGIKTLSKLWQGKQNDILLYLNFSQYLL